MGCDAALRHDRFVGNYAESRGGVVAATSNTNITIEGGIFRENMVNEVS